MCVPAIFTIYKYNIIFIIYRIYCRPTQGPGQIFITFVRDGWYERDPWAKLIIIRILRRNTPESRIGIIIMTSYCMQVAAVLVFRHLRVGAAGNILCWGGGREEWSKMLFYICTNRLSIENYTNSINRLSTLGGA